jgi:metallothionein
MALNEPGTILTCTNDDCECRLRIEVPCPHGDTYTCACGHPFVVAGSSPLRDVPG